MKQKKIVVCSVEGCDGVHTARGFCAKHYIRYLVHGDAAYDKKYPKFCSVDGCHRKHKTKGFCKNHDQHNRLYGHPTKKPPRKKIILYQVRGGPAEAHSFRSGYKLTPSEVLEIKEQLKLCRRGTVTLLAHKYGVSYSTISEIKNNKRYNTDSAIARAIKLEGSRAEN